MNANELADVFNTYDEPHDWGTQAKVMLRQQQAEIESMQERMIVAEKELNHMRSFFGCDPAYYGMTSAEPVAWMNKRTSKCVVFINTPPSDDWIPLYTHPVDAVNTSEQYVDKNENNRHDLGLAEAIGFDKGYVAAQAKTLTDEEIVEVINEHGWRGLTGYLLTFAHAILRKAQEK